MSRRQIHSVRATGNGAIALTVAPQGRWKLLDIRVHLSAVGGSGTLTGTLDHGVAAAYDHLILSQDMTSVTDLNLADGAFTPMIFGKGTELDIAWANAGTKTYGIEVIYEEV